MRTATIHSRFPERNPQPRKRVIRPKTTTGWLKARQAVKALDASVKEIQSEQTGSTPAIQRRSADYFDAIRGRIKYPLSDANLRKIRRHCSSADQHYYERIIPNDRLQRRRWYYYVNVVQPDRTCIKLLKRVGFAIFYVEIARDFVDRTQDLYGDFKKYFVQPWRRNAPVHYKGTAYGAPRNATVNFVFYPKYSDRLKAHSLHLEARLNGRKVLERAGITWVTDLLHFDFNDYWERKLVLRKVNLDRQPASVNGNHLIPR